jgi:putative DNA primase/helicase
MGWYKRRKDGKKRPRTVVSDSDELVQDVERTVYTAISFAPRDYYIDAWQDYDSSTDSDNPQPDYGDFVGFAPFVDVDLTDDAKAQRKAGELDAAPVEKAIDRYVAAFARLCGGRDAVFLLDSVGGAYPLVAPSVASPIADHFDREQRAKVYEELAARVNDYAKNVWQEIQTEIEGIGEMLDPDFVCHKNRVHKAPLTLHGDIDAVVTPMDTDSVRFELVRIETLSGDQIDAAKRWGSKYTADYSDRVHRLVAGLWPDYTDTASDWQDALEQWLDDEQTTKTTSSDQQNSTQSDSAPGYANIEDVWRAIDDLDATDVAEDTIVYRWNDGATSGKGQGFYPEWGPNSNGTANYVTEDVWHDTGSGDHGTVIEMALIGSSTVNWTRGKIAKGSDWKRGIRELNKLGYDVPLPERDTGDMSDYYGHDLYQIAQDHGFTLEKGNDRALLKACLLARRENPELSDAKPPYRALVSVAELADLGMEDSEENILGKATYKVARRIYDDTEPADIEL